MKLYRTIFTDRAEGTILSWHSSRVAANKAVKQRGKDYGAPETAPTITEVDVPTNKAGLIDWLNRHYDRANG